MKGCAALFALVLLSACGERMGRNEAGGGSTTPPLIRADEDRSTLGNATQPVRVGELGPGFAACNARGATRDRPVGATVPVRPAPFERTAEIDRLPTESEFFICARTHDQRWFGIVYARQGQDPGACGVAGPVARRGPYEGPCASGWVSSAQVRLVSGVPHQLAPESTNTAAPAP